MVQRVNIFQIPVLPLLRLREDLYQVAVPE